MRALSFSSLLLALGCAVAAPALSDHPAAGFAHGIGGPIVTIPAGTLPRGSWAASLRVDWVTFDALSDQELEAAALAGEDLHSTDALLSPSIGLAHGITDDITLGARLPYVARSGIREGHLELTGPEVHDHGDSKGVGDLTLLFQIRFLRSHDVGPEAAFLLGLKFPTGQTEVDGQDGEQFEVEHQPGTGSWDRLLGVAWSKPIGRTSVDGNVLATFTSEGSQGTKLGTLVNYNLAVSFRPSQHEHPRDAGEAEHQHDAREAEHREHVALDLVAEVNGEWRGPTEIGGDEEDNSGGSLVYLAPGLRLGTEGWSLSASLGTPVVQDLRGEQHETRLRMLLGFGVAF